MDVMTCSPNHRYIVAPLLLAALLWASCGDDDDSSTNSQNQPPIIRSLTAVPDTFHDGQITTITVDAEDPDGDPLSYDWEADQSWLLPMPGAPNTLDLTNCCPIVSPRTTFVHSIVSDDRGGQACDSVQIWALPTGGK